MTLRENFLENFAGDLEYHPRRGMLYVILGVAALCFWIFSSPHNKAGILQLVSALGGLALLIKSVFLFRKSSEGLALTQRELVELSNPSNRKGLKNFNQQAAQIVQDFGVGPLLLWPLLNFGGDIDHSWTDLPRFPLFVIGGVLFFLGWLARRLTSSSA